MGKIFLKLDKVYINTDPWPDMIEERPHGAARLTWRSRSRLGSGERARSLDVGMPADDVVEAIEKHEREAEEASDAQQALGAVHELFRYAFLTITEDQLEANPKLAPFEAMIDLPIERLTIPDVDESGKENRWIVIAGAERREEAETYLREIHGLDDFRVLRIWSGYMFVDPDHGEAE